MKIYQEFWCDDKHNKSPTPKIGCQCNKLKGNEANPSKKKWEKGPTNTLKKLESILKNLGLGASQKSPYMPN